MTPPPLPPVDGTVLKVKYSLTRTDILRWQFHLLLRNRVLLVFGMAVSLFLVWTDLRRPELAANPVGFKVFYAVFFTCFMFLIYGVVTMLLMASMVMFKKFRGLLGGHELEIANDGLVERTDVNESMHRWRGFHKVVATRAQLYIYVTDNNVHIVPRRCFASELEERAFRDELEKRMRAAQS